MDKDAVSRAVSQLLRNGRLLRVFHAADRRRSMLRLSAAGREVYRRGFMGLSCCRLEPDERRAFSRALVKLMRRAARLDHPTST